MSLRPALAQAMAVPCIPAPAGTGERWGSSFPSASPSLAFASQLSLILEAPAEQNGEEPSSSLGNGSRGCAATGPRAQPPAAAFERASQEPGGAQGPVVIHRVSVSPPRQLLRGEVVVIDSQTARAQLNPPLASP